MMRALGKRLALARSAGSQQKGSHTGCHAKTHRLNIAGNELHRVVNGQSCRHGTAGTVNVESNVLVGIFVGEIEELCNQDIGDFIVHVGSQKQDAVFKETGNDIELSGLTLNSGKGRR